MSEPSGGEAERPEFLDSLGARGRRRAQPRASVALAGAGCALAVVGVLMVAGDASSGSGADSFNQLPGALLTALVVAVGFVLLGRAGHGPLATAGTVAVVLGVPSLMLFATFNDDRLPPWSTEGILMISTLVYAVSYAVGPGRGRPLFLGAALLGAWATLLQVVEDVFDLPFTIVESISSFGLLSPAAEVDQLGPFGGPDLPDPTTVGLLSLGVGIAYVAASRRLDLRNFGGVATPFIVLALPALAVGVVSLGDEMGSAGSGLLLGAIGLGLALHGSSMGRRATTWIGGAACAVGLATFVGALAEDPAIVGVLVCIGGIGLVTGAQALATRLDEPDEMAPADPGRRHPLGRAPAPPPTAPPPTAPPPTAPPPAAT